MEKGGEGDLISWAGLVLLGFFFAIPWTLRQQQWDFLLLFWCLCVGHNTRRKNMQHSVRLSAAATAERSKKKSIGTKGKNLETVSQHKGHSAFDWCCSSSSDCQIHSLPPASYTFFKSSEWEREEERENLTEANSTTLCCCGVQPAKLLSELRWIQSSLSQTRSDAETSSRGQPGATILKRLGFESSCWADRFEWIWD